MTLPTKKEVLHELKNTYKDNIDEFVSSINSNISICNCMNEIYGNADFKPCPTEYFEEQLNILNSVDSKNYDAVNAPYHYTSGKYECLDVMRDVFGDAKVKIWCQLNAFKYLYRSDKKNGDEDLDKARFYLEYIKSNFKNTEGN